MKLSSVLIVTTTFLFGVISAQSDYCSISSQHTLCRYSGTGPACGQVIKREVTKADQEKVIKLHNDMRQKIAQGKEGRGQPGPQPSAANMRQLVWDDELAKVAQRLADQCVFNHDCGQCRRVARFQVGQNLYTSSSTAGDDKQDWAAAVAGWYNEVAMFDSKIVRSYSFSGSTGHYTQMVWAETYAVGCGFIMYPDGRFKTKLYACNYGPSGNFLSNPMYVTGPACSKCPAGTLCSPEYNGLCKAGLSDPVLTNDSERETNNQEDNISSSDTANVTSGNDSAQPSNTNPESSLPSIHSGTSFFKNGFGNTQTFSFLLNGFHPFYPFHSFRQTPTKFIPQRNDLSTFFVKGNSASQGTLIFSCSFEQFSSQQCRFSITPDIYTYQPYNGEGSHLTLDLMPGDKMTMRFNTNWSIPSTSVVCLKLTYLRYMPVSMDAGQSLDLVMTTSSGNSEASVSLLGSSENSNNWIKNKITFRNVKTEWSLSIQYEPGSYPHNVRIAFKKLLIFDGEC